MKTKTRKLEEALIKPIAIVITKILTGMTKSIKAIKAINK